MSVEISGPKGYDFQYLNSLLFALEYLDKDEVEIFIEKKNGEDTQVVFSEGGAKYTLDIQIKNRNEAIDLQSFVEWICHFESRSASCSLLNKLETDNKRFAVFISDARSKDDVSIFVDEGVSHTELCNGFSNDYLNKIRVCLKNCYSDSSSLSVSRKAFLVTFIDGISNNNLRNILKKIKLREKRTEEYSTDKIKRLLNRKFYIPQSKTDDVIVELIDNIRHSRGTNISITTDLIHTIDKHSGKILINKNENYIKRMERKSCVSILSAKNVLLLTGVSFCGKSYLAKDIAQEYLENGYRVERVGELYGDGGAISFIKYRGIEDRLVILEDPFGQVATKKEALSIFSDIRNLIRESKLNRKIIITSRKDILLDTTSKKNINECSIDLHCWIDLTLDTSEKMIELLWESYYGDSVESKNICNEITKWLEKTEKSSSLQLGHIANIYSTKKELSSLIKLEPIDIISAARIDSDDLATNIEGRGSTAIKVFIALGLSCNTYKPVTLNDFAFLLSNSQEQPGICEDEKEYMKYTLDKDLDDDEHGDYPKYDFNYKLNNEYKNELKYLQQHGYIQIDNIKRIMFVHPIYHFATQLLFKKQFMDVLEQQDVIELVQKSLGSLSINANLCTLNILESLYKEKPDSNVKQLMLIGLDSIFPSVKDKIIMFFDRRINDLNEMEQEKFVKVLMYGADIKNDGISWHDGMPYFNATKERSFSYRDWLHDKLSNNEDDSLLNKISSGIDISSEEMWRVLKARSREVLPLNVLEKALSYDESFIRGKAIKLIFENYAFGFGKLDEYLNIREHPEVIYSLFRGALNSWLRYSSEAKRVILNYFKNSLDIMSVAIRTKNLLENFEDEYSSESIKWSKVAEKDKSELWNIWHEVFIEFLNKFPSRYVSMNEAHMVNVTEHSLEFINSEEKVVELSTAWFKWLDSYLHYNLPQDYGMSVARYLMVGTRNRVNLRENIFKMMLSTEKTSFITSNITVFIDCWNDLAVKEKNIVLDLYKSTRKDAKWIKAVSLNRKIIPYEIQVEILGENIDDKNIPNVVDILIQQDLLEQCLNIHCGYPQPLWWNGYHHNNYKLWDAVIVEVLKRNGLNRAFDIALREVVDLLYNYEDKRIPNIYDIYEHDLLKNSDKRKLVFSKLLYVTIEQNQCNKKLWDLLLQFSSEEELAFYFDKIAEDIELVQYHQVSYGDLFALFDKSVIFEEIYPRLKDDNVIVDFVHIMLKSYKAIKNRKKDLIQKLNEKEILKVDGELEKLRNTFILYVTQIYKDNPPRCFLSNTFVASVIKKIEIVSSELENLIEKNRVRLIDITSDLRKKYDDHYDLADWIN